MKTRNFCVAVIVISSILLSRIQIASSQNVVVFRPAAQPSPLNLTVKTSNNLTSAQHFLLFQEQDELSLDQTFDGLWETVGNYAGRSYERGDRSVFETWTPIGFDMCSLTWRYTKTETSKFKIDQGGDINDWEEALTIDTTVEELGVLLDGFDASSVKTYRDDYGGYAVLISSQDDRSIGVKRAHRNFIKRGWEDPEIKERHDKVTSRSYASVIFNRNNIDSKRRADTFANLLVHAIHLCRGKNLDWSEDWLAKQVVLPKESYTPEVNTMSLSQAKRRLIKLFDEYGDVSNQQFGKQWSSFDENKVASLRAALRQEPSIGDVTDMQVDNCSLWVVSAGDGIRIYRIPFDQLQLPGVNKAASNFLTLNTLSNKAAILELLSVRLDCIGCADDVWNYSINRDSQLMITLPSHSIAREMAKAFYQAIKQCRRI
jgi:hypothetical protein